VTVKFEILRTLEFNDWLEKQSEKIKLIVDARFQRISVEGYFGVTNYFDNIIELKWKSGLRVYLYRDRIIILAVFGGTKHGQKRDIKKAKGIIARRLNQT
jgi:putative addiction module killer protein